MKTRNKNKAKTRLMDLPIEILIEILKRLPIKSVCCIRCVSKTLSDIVYSPFFVDLHTRFLIPTNSLAGAAPQLVLRHVESYPGSTRRKLTALESLNYDESEGKLTLSEIFSTSQREFYSDVAFVFYDLICFKKAYMDGNCILNNPLCGEVLRVPTSNILYTKFGKDITFFDDSYGMGFDDITSTYKIVRISRIYERPSYSKSYVVAQLLVLGTSSWREIPVHPVIYCAIPWDKSVCAYGDMHWLFVDEGEAKGVHIVSFDFKKEKFYLTPNPVTSRMPYLHLITLGESIAIVDTYFSSMKVEIWVMKNYNKKEWKREYIINHHMLGLDVDFRFHRANCGEMEYGIYFIDEKGENLLFLDLRPSSMKCVACPIGRKKWNGRRRILSLKRSLISLKKFGDLVEEPESGGQSAGADLGGGEIGQLPNLDFFFW
ncbi:F-box/kelch-repeat protein [Rosa sericea]